MKRRQPSRTTVAATRSSSLPATGSCASPGIRSTANAPPSSGGSSVPSVLGDAAELRPLAVGDRGRDELADLGEEAGGQLAGVLAGARLAADRVEEADADAGAPREAGEVAGALDRDQRDVRLGDLEGEAAD